MGAGGGNEAARSLRSRSAGPEGESRMPRSYSDPSSGTSARAKNATSSRQGSPDDLVTQRLREAVSQDTHDTKGNDGIIAHAMEVASQAAREFIDYDTADTNGVGTMEWQFMFRLARRLLAVPGVADGDVMRLRRPVLAFLSTLADLDYGGAFIDFSEEAFEDRWIDFVDALHKVRMPEGSGPLELAFKHAKQAPITPEPAIGPDYVLVASTAYYLQHLQGDEPILLPVERVGSLFGKDKMHGSRLVQLLVHYGLIQVVDGDYSYTKQKAKTYKFVFDSGRYRGPELRS